MLYLIEVLLTREPMSKSLLDTISFVKESEMFIEDMVLFF